MELGYEVSSLADISKDIRKENKSLRNRLQSINYDNKFLEDKVIKCFPDYPIIPNERCGLWYCNSEQYMRTSYFKSTDGHTHQWDFSTRRLNFHLLPILQENNGVTIIDSTRRGKKIPDALSKTIPIWCAVLNYIMLKSTGNEIKLEDILYVPPATVSKSEYSSIMNKLPHLVEKLEALDVINGNELYEKFGGKILRPFWVFPGSSMLQASVDVFTGEPNNSVWEVTEGENIIPVILCTVSYQTQDGMDKRNGFTYVQGAADDHELWSCGLTPKMFWDNHATLCDPSKSDDELFRLAENIVLEKKFQGIVLDGNINDAIEEVDDITAEFSLGRVNDGLKIDKQLYLNLKNTYSLIIIMSDNVELLHDQKENDEDSIVNIYKLRSGSKKSSKDLRIKLPEIYDIISKITPNDKKVLICCNTGTDMSIGILLTVLCKDYSLNWTYLKKDGDITQQPRITKTEIRKHLSHLISHLNGRNVNPSRATLNSVNSYLM